MLRVGDHKRRSLTGADSAQAPISVHPLLPRFTSPMKGGQTKIKEGRFLSMFERFLVTVLLEEITLSVKQSNQEITW
jgi:hypothetical protein